MEPFIMLTALGRYMCTLNLSTTLAGINKCTCCYRCTPHFSPRELVEWASTGHGCREAQSVAYRGRAKNKQADGRRGRSTLAVGEPD